ncbi:LytTR family DNA-binding domain-containing protein [Phenylobacterium sp. J367]|uniref:LytTR family DNA-binding domain-containing protein n=1 Tax=Phenylobacterium sp. J367 TaxID=2898435 RepID=UPI002150D101|nr:LytTR family DNA-binding domain-containing protein [Phenylobacterium sp. J367]MCR5880023.1 LytTR family transcriptional regulator DNA-binding domain-containing protein [Phenylobacterium sp. J367]
MALRRRRTPAPAIEAPALAAAALSDVLCLQMEDHYVRIHTAQGSRLAHGTLGQAMAAQAGREGLQVHRSWWVARDAVRGHVWDGRNLRLELVNGVQAPVSRAAVARLRGRRVAAARVTQRQAAAAMEPA